MLVGLFESGLYDGMYIGGGRVGKTCIYPGLLLVHSELLGDVGSGHGLYTVGCLLWLPQHQVFGGDKVIL